MGGTNDSSNLIKLTIEEHAEAHKSLYEQHGKEEDRIAWLALSGQVTMSEISKMRMKLGRIRANETISNNPDLAVAGGIATRDKKVGIHDPSKIHLKQQGGKEAIKKMPKWIQNSKWMTNGIKDTRIALDEVDNYLSKGWKLGKISSPNRGKKNLTKNLFWINKEGTNKRIPEDQIEYYIENGWSSGVFKKS
jgi:hypothetical protein